MKKYIPLHVHSMYSLLDGLSKPEQIADRCEEIGVKSCALTDHGNIAGAIKFYGAMKKRGIKPILGCELYICDNDATIKDKENRTLSHFLVLAKNYDGWKNLIRIVSESNRPEHYYFKPRLDLKTLGEMMDGNMIGICGHLGSTIANKIMENDAVISDWENIGKEHIRQCKDIFGEENFFLEAQLMDRDNNEPQIHLTDCIRKLSKLTNTKVICTPDAHYCKKSDAVDQRILLCNNLKTTFTEINRKLSLDEDVPMKCFFTSDNYHILSQEEIQELHTEEEIENTNLVDSM